MESRSFSIDELSIPASPAGPGWAEFAAAVEVRNRVESHAYGTGELAQSAEELLPAFLTPEDSPRRLFVARAAGTIVARALYETQSDPASEFAWFTVEVLPEWRGRGIGSALSTVLESLADAERRSSRVVYAVSPPGPGERVAAPTGFGSVPLANPEVRFLLNRGYRLEQVERGSRLQLPVDPAFLTDQLAAAGARAGEDYAVLSWSGRTPERWLPDLALLYTRMSTDAPTAGLEEPEEVWTVERLRREQDVYATGPRLAVVTAALHRPSGRLVGFTELSVPGDPGRAVSQEDTLVLREHRGHRLGMLMKLANLKQLALGYPEQRAVTTFNAEENRYMLDVNEAVGFTPMGYEGAWRKVSAAAGSAGSSARTGS
ncbi:GNAT family N-acetyltransferase [Cryobacterium lactosi]|uniref:GNAT family N-acetyltransferase n=1 Tax=Cryobacterium lactosi TaxID=1259202 RepID=A0A4V6QIZ4_9MICO|nr:GNAT family N-acetyltransferase [Cryobacterium lactosi]TFD92017.1 GNAT family N-acetyltransferase [Cryobacterium lactosi]